jgi:MYXO-CTERM domain-containing protein
MHAAIAAEIRLADELAHPNARGGRTYAIATPYWTQVMPAGTWPLSSLPLQLYVGLPKSRDLGESEDAEIEVAARAWNRVSCTGFRAEVAGTTSTGPGDDGVSGVYFEDDAWPASFTQGAIATTVVHVDAQGHIYDADVYVNGADHTFSLDGHGTTIDFRSIATHEIGHVLGLGESNDPRATMYAAYPPGVAWRSLEQDDENGVCTLYPGTGDLLGCEATPCPGPFLCVARQCERPGDQRMPCSPCDPSLPNGCEGAGDKARCVALLTGYACGSPCASNDDCGPGFSCVPTTQAGDYQCLPANDCASAANTCQTVANCNDPDDAGWVCSSGACLGSLPPADAGASDAGDAGAPDASADGGSPLEPPRGGCSCDAAPSGAGRSALALALAALALAARRRRETSRP